MRRIIFLSLLFTFEFATAQNVGVGTNTPDPSAKFEVSSTNSGFLPPRMTYAQRNAIVNPVAGLIIYCTDCANGEWQGYNGSYWMNMVIGISTTVPADSPSVPICNQVWTSKNLDVNHYRNGNLIPQVTDSTQWANLTTGAWCWYNNDSASYWQYGKLYNWYAVNDARGLAPLGWHIPSRTEWNKLVKCFDPNADTTAFPQSTTAGGAMKEAGTSHWLSPNTGAINSKGFRGIPSGFRGGYYWFRSRTDFDYFGRIGIWWTSTEPAFDQFHAWANYLEFSTASEYPNWKFNKTDGYSVRLVKD